MENTDKELLEIYMLGFNDELDGNSIKTYFEEEQNTAYIFGRTDALVGDDLSSVDNQTNEQILQRIKRA